MEVNFWGPGEGIESGTLLSILVESGKEVEINQPIAEVETVKSVYEVPSPYDGIISKWLVDVGVNLCRGETMCVITPKNSEVK